VTGNKLCPLCGKEYGSLERFCPDDGTALRDVEPSSDLVGRVLADRYLVVRKLGVGGMGQVYLAEHVRMRRKSAVKVMKPELLHSADAISRFTREAGNASQVAHTHVAAIYDFGETNDGIVYLAMEYVDGEPLTAIIQREGALPPPRAAEITRQAAEGLSAAHELGIVHRDLKPDNIMVARNRDGSDLVKVVDFGIAKVMEADDQKVTRTGLVIGTPAYMSPEQVVGGDIDGRSDLYSLALVAFNMLTGQLPFPGRSTPESVFVRLTTPAKTLASVKPDVEWPAAVQAVLDRALAREPDARYQSAREFGHELARAVQWMSGPPRGPFDTYVPPFAPPQSTVGTLPGGVSGGTPSRAAPAAASAESVGAATVAAEVAPPRAPRSRTGRLVAAAAAATLGAVGVAVIAVGRRSDEPTPRQVRADSVAAPPTQRSQKSPAAGGTAASQPGAPAISPSANPPATTSVPASPPRQPSSEPARDSANPRRAPAVIDSNGDRTVTLRVPASPSKRTQRPTPVPPAAVPPAAATPGASTMGAGAPAPTAPTTDTAAKVGPTTVRPEPPRPESAVGTPAAPTSAAVANREAERAAAAAEVRRTVEELVQALSARDMSRFQRAYPDMTAAEREGWQALFGSRDVSDFSARLVRADQPEIDGTTARISFGVRLEYKDREQGRVNRLQPYRATLQRGSGGWRVALLREAEG